MYLLDGTATATATLKRPLENDETSQHDWANKTINGFDFYSQKPKHEYIQDHQHPILDEVSVFDRNHLDHLIAAVSIFSITRRRRSHSRRRRRRLSYSIHFIRFGFVLFCFNML